METKIGIIKTITEAVTKKGGVYYRFEMQDGTKVNNFDCTQDDHKIGDTVDMEGEQKGQYWNLQRMSPHDGVVPVEVIGKPSENETFVKSPDTSRQILRMSCVKSAAELIKAVNPTEKEREQMSWQEIASDIEAWILR